MTWQEKVRRLMHGKRWHRALSNAVGAEESSLRRWLDGENQPRDEVALLAKLAPALTKLSARPVTVDWLLDSKATDLPPIVPGLVGGKLSPLEAQAEASIRSLPVREGELARAMLDPEFVELATMLLAIYRRAERQQPR